MVKIYEDSSHPIDFVAKTDIKEGEQISFDYTTTEWDMGAPFTDAATGEIYARSLHGGIPSCCSRKGRANRLSAVG